MPSILLPISGAIISMLMMGNIFFVKRLVDQLDATREIVWSMRQELVVLKYTVDNMSHKHEN